VSSDSVSQLTPSAPAGPVGWSQAVREIDDGSNTSVQASGIGSLWVLRKGLKERLTTPERKHSAVRACIAALWRVCPERPACQESLDHARRSGSGAKAWPVWAIVGDAAEQQDGRMKKSSILTPAKSIDFVSRVRHNTHHRP
jgi:hypothetical protein